MYPVPPPGDRSDGEFRLETPSSPPRCPFCQQEVVLSPSLRCARCRVVYHPDCWEANGRRCAVYGCETSPPAPVPAASAGTRIPEPQSAGSRVGLHIGIFGFLLLSALLRSLGSSRPPTPSEVPTVRPGVSVQLDLVRAEGLLREAVGFAASVANTRPPPEAALRTSLRPQIEEALNRLELARRLFVGCLRGRDPAPASRGLLEVERTLEMLYRFRDRLDRADAESRRR